MINDHNFAPVQNFSNIRPPLVDDPIHEVNSKNEQESYQASDGGLKLNESNRSYQASNRAPISRESVGSQPTLAPAPNDLGADLLGPV